MLVKKIRDFSSFFLSLSFFRSGKYTNCQKITKTAVNKQREISASYLKTKQAATDVLYDNQLDDYLIAI